MMEEESRDRTQTTFMQSERELCLIDTMNDRLWRLPYSLGSLEHITIDHRYRLRTDQADILMYIARFQVFSMRCGGLLPTVY